MKIEIHDDGAITCEGNALEFFITHDLTKGVRNLFRGADHVADVTHVWATPARVPVIRAMIVGHEMALMEKAGLGRGRPRHEHRGRPRNIYMDDATFEAAKALGEGNASEGIRRAVMLQL